MTDMLNGMSQGQDTSVSSPVTSTSTPVSQPAQTEEKSFKQSEVNDIVKRVKNDAVESYKRMQVEQPQYLQQKHPDAVTQPSSWATNTLSQDDVRRMAAEEAQRLRDQWIKESHQKSQEADAQRIAQEFLTKLSTGKDKYQDFEKVTGDMDYAQFSNTVQLANSYIDNTVDVMYELGKDRIKMANMELLARMSPRDAIVQMQRLSQSIKDNEAASKVRMPNEPLSQLRPSNTGTDSGVKEVRDYKLKYRA
jgi:hypothetical protein